MQEHKTTFQIDDPTNSVDRSNNGFQSHGYSDSWGSNDSVPLDVTLYHQPADAV